MRTRFAALGTALLLASPLQAAERTYKVGSFNELQVAGPYRVSVATGRSAGVRAVGETSDLDEMRVSVSDGKLRIRPRQPDWKLWRTAGPVTVRVTVPMLRAASLAGSGSISIDRVHDSSFSGAVAGSGSLSVAAVDADEVELSVAGSGGIRAGGRCTEADLSIAGSGGIAAAGLRCQTADISVAGSGDVALNAARTADISIMGTGNVTVAGGAKCDVTKMGSGKAVCTR